MKKIQLLIIISVIIGTMSGCLVDDKCLDSFIVSKFEEERNELETYRFPNFTEDSFVDLGLPSGTKWCKYNLGAETPEDLGVYVKWRVVNQIIPSGGKMPSLEQAKELIENCEWKWIHSTDGGGYSIKGPNGNEIFLPGGGRFDTSSIAIPGYGSYGYYWIASSDSFEDTTFKSALYIAYFNTPHICDMEPNDKLNIRCVK